MKSAMGCFFAVIISCFYLGSFYMLGLSLWYAWHARQPASWPPTPGTIIQLSLEENSDSDGTSYKVKVRYTYVVDGNSYEGDQLAFGYGGSSGREAHEEIHRKLKDAQRVAVRYNPADPAVSCLSFGLHRSIQLLFVFSITMLAFTVGFTLLVWLISQADSVLLDNLLVQ